MHVITKSCILLLWMHTLTFVKSQVFKCRKPAIENGFVIGNVDVYNENGILNYRCNQGYKQSQEIDSRCMNSGGRAEWIPTPACEAIKCELSLPPIRGTSYQPAYRNRFSPGEKVRVTCGDSYWILDSRVLSAETTCKEDGEWTIRPVCQEVMCGHPRDRYFSIWGDSWFGPQKKLGDTVRYGCKSGYRSTDGATQATCTRDGWEPNPLCRVFKCRKPAIENGFVIGNVDVYDENDILNYRCNQGYKQSQEIDSRCMNSGGRAEWIPTPACEANAAIKCELSLPPVRGTTYQPAYRNRFSPGEKVRVTCGDSYWISDSRGLSAEATCKEDGEWTIRPVCQEVTCSRPRDGYLSNWEDSWFGPQKKMGDTVRYRCVRGYRSTDDATQATCTRDGWEPNPLCREIKCAMRSYNNAEIIGRIQSEYRYNDRVTYKCKSADKERFTLICGENGWIGDNRCTGCQIKSSEHRFEVWPPGNKLYYTCEDGYKPLTKGWWAEATCDGGVWSGLEDCIEERECGDPPVIPNGEGIFQSFDGQSQNSIFITCKKGYTAVIETLTCHEGQWDLAGRSLDAICRSNADNCSPPLKVENAVVTTPYQKEYPSGSTVTYQCRAKYTVEDEATITCTAGEWEKRNIKCILYCEQLKDEWQTMDFTAEKEKYKNGEIIKYQCTTKAGSSGTATCQDGKWTKTTECEEKCTVPEIPASLRITTDVPGSQIMRGQNLTFACEDSRPIMKGTAMIKCLPNGQWSNDVPTCRVGWDCAWPPRLSNGQMKGSEKSQYRHNEKVEYVCHSGYIMEGGPFKTCIDNEWTGEMGCRRALGCLKPPRISNGQMKGSGKSQYRHNEKVEYVCDSGYIMEGGPFKTCIDAEWTGEMRCRLPQGCGRPPPLSDGDTTTTPKHEYRHNEKVKYICPNYYVMEGGPFKTCFNAEWTGNITCLRPCTVDREQMDEHNIQFRYKADDKLYSQHNEEIEFVCTKGRRVGTLGMRQRCEHGVMQLPTCQ